MGKSKNFCLLIFFHLVGSKKHSNNSQGCAEYFPFIYVYLSLSSNCKHTNFVLLANDFGYCLCFLHAETVHIPYGLFPVGIGIIRFTSLALQDILSDSTFPKTFLKLFKAYILKFTTSIYNELYSAIPVGVSWWFQDLLLPDWKSGCECCRLCHKSGSVHFSAVVSYILPRKGRSSIACIMKLLMMIYQIE